MGVLQLFRATLPPISNGTRDPITVMKGSRALDEAVGDANNRKHGGGGADSEGKGRRTSARDVRSRAGLRAARGRVRENSALPREDGSLERS